MTLNTPKFSIYELADRKKNFSELENSSKGGLFTATFSTLTPKIEKNKQQLHKVELFQFSDPPFPISFFGRTAYLNK